MGGAVKFARENTRCSPPISGPENTSRVPMRGPQTRANAHLLWWTLNPLVDSSNLSGPTKISKGSVLTSWSLLFFWRAKSGRRRLVCSQGMAPRLR